MGVFVIPEVVLASVCLPIIVFISDIKVELWCPTARVCAAVTWADGGKCEQDTDGAAVSQ